MPQTCEMPHGGTLTSFSWKQTLWKKSLLKLVRPPSVLLVRCVKGECVPGLQTLLVHLSFVPRLACVLPLLLLHVWKGQQGQHGEGKEGRLCPALPPGCPEGKGGVEGRGAEEAGQREKDIFPPLFLSSFLPGLLFCHPLFFSSSFFLLSHFVPLTTIMVIAHWFQSSVSYHFHGLLDPSSCQIFEKQLSL